MGGSDDPSNIIELSVQEHAMAHLILYETHGKMEDLCAYYMLSGRNQDPEFVRLRGVIGGTNCAMKRKESGLVGSELFYGRSVSGEELSSNASIGGKIQGQRNADSGHMANIQKMVDMSSLGKRNSEICRSKKVNAFFDPSLRKEISSKGGKVQGKRNADSGHLKRIAQLPSKRNSGKRWITNGAQNKMIDLAFDIPDGFVAEKTQKKTIKKI